MNRELGTFGWLVVALAAVNNYPLQKSYDPLDPYRETGFLDLQRVRRATQEEIFDWIRAAGYTHSDFVTGLVAQRIRAASLQLTADDLAAIDTSVVDNDREAVSAALLPLPGVGPSVLRNFEYLSGLLS